MEGLNVISAAAATSSSSVAAGGGPSVLEMSDTDMNMISGLESLCRLCANTSDRLIAIYGEEGTTNDLATKMNLYLPIKINETDTLPLQCCWHCATTVLTWHELIVACVEADRRLRAIESEETETTAQQMIASCAGAAAPEPVIHSEAPSTSAAVPDASDPIMPAKVEPQESSDSSAACLSAFCQSDEPGRKKVRRKKIEIDSGAELLLKDEPWSKDDAGNLDDPLENYIVNMRIPLMTDCGLNVDDDEDDMDYDDVGDMSGDEKDVKVKLNYAKDKSEEDVEEVDRILTEWISKSTDGKFTEMMSFTCDCCSKHSLSLPELIQHIKDQHPELVSNLKKEQSKEDEASDGANAAVDDQDEKKQQQQQQQRRKNTKLDREAVNAAKITVDGRVYYHCHICGKNLHSPYTYIWHNRIHTGERPFVCDLCGKQFRVSQGLVRHLRETHQGVKNFPCDICGRMFATRRNVEEHRRIHTNERPYICDLCGKSFKQKASLFVHNRSHNDSFPFKCTYCDQGFRTRPPLLVHVTRHTGEKPYPCDVCGRCFRIKYELKRHRLIHSDEKPFSCTDCGISFRQKRYLRNHNKINHNRTTD